jgi:hypothetical protein
MLAKLPLTVLGLLLLFSTARAQTLDPAKIKSRDVVYVSHTKLKEFPTPILEYRNFDPQRHEVLAKEVVERIVYPMLCESETPIAVVAVDFCPEIRGDTVERGCKDEDKGKLMIEVAIRRQGGSGFMSVIDTDLKGRFDDDAYLTLFTAGYEEYVPRNKACRPLKREGAR